MLDSWKSNETRAANGTPHHVRSEKREPGSIVWVRDVPIGASDAVVIAGPCSVESRTGKIDGGRR